MSEMTLAELPDHSTAALPSYLPQCNSNLALQPFYTEAAR
jgi:hypothetical protein